MNQLRVFILVCCGVHAANAQRLATVESQSLQRILVAEDARGTGMDSIAPLVDGLASRDTLLRRVAVRAIGRLQRPALVASIIPLLGDHNPAVRATTANAVGQALSRARRTFSAGDSSQTVVALAAHSLIVALGRERNRLVADAMIESLGRLALADSTEARTAERGMLEQVRARPPTAIAMEGWYWLARARRQTGALTAGTVDWIRGGVRTATSASARRVALLALSANGSLDSATVLSAAHDADAQVRRLALASIATLSPASRAAVLQRAFADASPLVRVAAMAAARTGNARPDCAAIAVAAGDANDQVALTAIDALGSPCVDEPAAAATLVQIVRSRRSGLPVATHGWQRAAHALLALAKAEPARATPFAATFAVSPSWGERLYAARTAAVTRDTALLIRFSDDSDHNVREAAITGLSAVVKHAGDSVYIAALHASGNQVVLAAATALNGTPSANALPALLDAFDSISARHRENSRDPRREILRRITELGSAKDAPRVTPWLADFDTTIAFAADSALRKWGVTATPHPVPLSTAAAPLARTYLQRLITVKVTMSEASGGGSFVVDLLADEAPVTVARIVTLVRQHYYDGHVFQRVEPDFVVQGGGPDASEYVGDSIFTRDELGQRSHARGTVGMSSRGRDTGDAQWFVNLVDNTRLDHEYTVFGQVTSGMQIVDAILEGDTIARVEIVRGRARRAGGSDAAGSPSRTR